MEAIVLLWFIKFHGAVIQVGCESSFSVTALCDNTDH